MTLLIIGFLTGLNGGIAAQMSFLRAKAEDRPRNSKDKRLITSAMLGTAIFLFVMFFLFGGKPDALFTDEAIQYVFFGIALIFGASVAKLVF